jgi:hypothetical protein
VGTRSRAIERRLRTVQELPSADAQRLLPHLATDDDDGDGEVTTPT